MSRSLRRTLLELLDGMNPERLVEDLLRHQSYWVWVGELLHPHEYAKRFPNAALAFQVVRKKAPDGTPAPRVRTWARRLEEAVGAGDALAMLAVLDERPGEFARRLDHVLRLAGEDAAAVDRIVAVFAERVTSLATPVLLTLLAHLPRRTVPAAVRIYWPRGNVAKATSSADRRASLTHRAIEPAVRAVNAELIRRFSSRPGFGTGIIDESLGTIVMPFNERTASVSAVVLPRGSCVSIPEGNVLRMFMHWCQPELKSRTTDLDLSVALYDARWTYLGVCSYYELTLTAESGTVIARSAGDLRSAPWPDGATEFVDLHRAEALAAGARYAVMVVNNFGGMHFSQLERAFAGIMLRGDTGGAHFDPRTVELRFSFDGENGMFLPLVLDLQASELHWLDVQSKGEFELNNVAKSQQAITTICPQMLAYFRSAVRPTVLQLALLHAAARCESVTLRAENVRRFHRRRDEDAVSFHERLVSGAADEEAADPAALEAGRTNETGTEEAAGLPIFAALFRGDIDAPDGSVVYSLFRLRTLPTISASDLLA
jgi:hypothetical protein